MNDTPSNPNFFNYLPKVVKKEALTADKWNSVIDAVNTFSQGVRAPKQIFKTVAPSNDSSSGGSDIALYKVLGEASNHLGVQAYDGVQSYGPQLACAKPDGLLQTISTRGNLNFAYLSGPQCNITDTVQGITLPFFENPAYTVGDIISAVSETVSLPAGITATLRDLNDWGRTWGTTGNVVSGLQGPSGNAGLNGAQGVQGPQGTGPQGASGTQGATGVQGLSGPQGATGAGTQGVAGSNGSTGANGAQGTQGPQGSGSGFQGFQGPQGSSSGGGSGTGPQAAKILALGAVYLGVQFLDGTGTGQGPQATCARQYLNRPLSSWNGITYSGYLANGCQRTATNTTTENEFLTPPPVVGDEILVATVLWGGATGITYIDLTSRIWATQ